MRSGENDAGIGTQRSRDVSHTGRRQRTDDENIYPERGDSGDERVFEHVPRKTRVLAKDDFGTCPLRVLARIQLSENVCGGATQFQRCLRRDRLRIGNAADAVSSENFLLLGHGVIETLERSS